MRFLLVQLLLIFCSTLNAAPIKKLVIIGDSITEGYGVSRDQAYPSLLQKKIDKAGKQWQIVNSGISGSTSASALSRVNWLLKQQKPEIVIVALGGNDGLRGAPAAKIEANLGAAVAACKNAGVKVILAGMKLPPNLGAAYTRDFENVFRHVADKYSIPLIPFLLDKVGGESGLNLTDGIHPNEKGHAVVADTVFSAIKQYL